MEFRLTYKGPLEPQGNGRSGSKRQLKQHLRKTFHKQLRSLWSEHPELKEQKTIPYTKYVTPKNSFDPPPGIPIINKALILPSGKPADPNARPWVEYIAAEHTTEFGVFVPLVRKSNGFNCEISILFLRRDAPGALFTQGGDIDNRIKTLLDGLRIPQNREEVGSEIFGPDETPLYSLLEDDNLITSIKVITDRLLEPIGPGESIKDVQLVIHAAIINPSAIFAGGVFV